MLYQQLLATIRLLASKVRTELSKRITNVYDSIPTGYYHGPNCYIQRKLPSFPSVLPHYARSSPRSTIFGWAYWGDKFYRLSLLSTKQEFQG